MWQLWLFLGILAFIKLAYLLWTPLVNKKGTMLWLFCKFDCNL